MNSTHKKRLQSAEYIHGLLAGDRVILSQAITLVESQLDSDVKVGHEVIDAILPHTGGAIRIGMTGAPGVGKSTIIESFGNYLISEGKKIAVLAVDPSSQKSKGSILGDKTRMVELSRSKNAYIRPTSSGNNIGGVARKTREVILLCEAAGFDIVLVETVGVGQSETVVSAMVDFFLLLLMPGAGDELQGIKKGIMEMSNMLVINKADGQNLQPAKKAKAEYENALHLFAAAESGWEPKVLTCSALENRGIPEIWQNIIDYRNTTMQNGFFAENRKKQNLDWMHELIKTTLTADFYLKKEMKDSIKVMEDRILKGNISSSHAANELVTAFKVLQK